MTTEQKSTIEILRSMRELLSDERRWTRFCLARAADNSEISCMSNGATCWCLVGAMCRQTDSLLLPTAQAALEMLWDSVKARHPAFHQRTGRNLSTFNDDPGTTHADVLGVLDHAIGLAAGGAGQPH